MLNMLGRIMWIAVGALGAKAVDAALENNKRKTGGRRSTRKPSAS